MATYSAAQDSHMDFQSTAQISLQSVAPWLGNFWRIVRKKGTTSIRVAATQAQEQVAAKKIHKRN